MLKLKLIVKRFAPASLLHVWKLKKRFFYDLTNKVIYGRNAPVKFQCIYVNPSEITRHLGGSQKLTSLLGKTLDQCNNVVIDGQWDEYPYPISEIPIYQRARDRVIRGLTWFEVGQIEAFRKKIAIQGVCDGCISEADIQQRYAALDQLIEEVKVSRRLRPSVEIEKTSSREERGIQVAISRNGEIYKVGNGNHRLAIAQALALPAIPVGVALVHPQSIRSGAWRKRLLLSRELGANKKDVESHSDEYRVSR